MLIHGQPDRPAEKNPVSPPAALRESALAFKDHPKRHTFEMAAQWMTECSPEDVLALLDRLDRAEAIQEFPIR